MPSRIGRVDGEARIATDGETAKGVLTAGPLAKIAAGTYDVEYPVPASAIGDASQITVRFQAHPGSNAGGIFGCGTEKG